MSYPAGHSPVEIQDQIEMRNEINVRFVLTPFGKRKKFSTSATACQTISSGIHPELEMQTIKMCDEKDH